jgi:tripartite-type tricarboxylate transporter receptor subunit TctC
MTESPRRRALCTLFFTAAVLATAGVPAHGAYPDHAIRLMVPQGAGGTGDAVSRIVGQGLAERIGKSVVVENKPGAGGTLGTSVVARAPADGYSLVLTSTGFATWSSMYSKLPFNPTTDIAAVAMMGSLPFAFLVPGDAPYKTVAEFVAFAKANPGKVNFGSAGNGALSHLLAAWFAAEAGITPSHIPYGGTAPALSALMGKQVEFYFDPVATSAGLVKSGKLRALATTGAQRSKVMPDVPTLVESGYPVRGSVWLALSTTGGTPAPVIERLNREINTTLKDPKIRQQLEAKGITVETMSPAELGAFYASEIKTWSKLVRDNGIKPE